MARHLAPRRRARLHPAVGEWCAQLVYSLPTATAVAYALALHAALA